MLTAGAATPLDEIEVALARAGQMLAFEPPDWTGLFDLPASAARRATLGVCSPATSQDRAGSRRARHATISSVSRGQRRAARCSRRAAKSSRTSPVTTCRKLMAGSYGTLAALEEVTIKVLPRPEAACTVMLCGLDPAAAVER